MVRDIAVIAPDVELMQLFEKVRRENIIDFTLRRGLFEDGVEAAREVVAEGAKVIISRGETTTQIRKAAIPVPVVDIPISVHDVIPLIDQARNFSTRIAVVGFGAVVRAAEAVVPILSTVEVEIFRLAAAREIPETVARVRDMGFTVLVGTPQAVALARTMGIRGFQFKTSESVIMATLTEAAKLAEVVRRENEWRLRQQAFVNSRSDGVLFLDGQGRLMHDNLRQQVDAAIKRALFRQEGKEFLLAHAEILDAVRSGCAWRGAVKDGSGTEYVCKVQPVTYQDQNYGAVVMLEKPERPGGDVRHDMFQRGFVARHTFEELIHESEVMGRLIAAARNYAAVDSSVLILGESGTGKELVAQSLHNASRRRHGPFVAVNCAALPEQLLESELFGYQGGAFTGASKSGKLGLFELADAGTIFLDEIGEMSLHLQVKLLRVLEERCLMRVGGERVIPVDVRVICATNRNLEEMVARERFRQDLYFRINVLRLTLPPLRERGSCIEALVRHYLDELSERLGCACPSLAPAAREVLLGYPYPGNVRELKSILERLVVTYRGQRIGRDEVLEGLGEALRPDQVWAGPAAARLPSDRQVGGELLRQEELRLIHRVLGECRGNKAETARRLGISTATLWRRLRREQLQ